MVIYIPENLGKQNYQIIDIMGRKVDEGLLNSGSTVIVNEDWSDGVYMIRFQSTGPRDQQISIMRFNIQL